MKNIKEYITIIIGCILIAVGYNLFIFPNHFMTFGALGLTSLLSYNSSVIPALNLLIINVIILLLGYLINPKKTSKYLIPSFVIPVCVFLTSKVYNMLNISLNETMLVVIAGSFISGLGYSMIYKTNHQAGIIFLIEDLIGDFLKFHSKIYSWFIDIILLIIYLFQFGIQSTLYSIIILVITKYMITKARYGISDSKMFYIITTKEKEVKNYIIHDLKYELTVLDVKGGFSKKNNKIFLSIISTSDYYRLKEGIKEIDPKAFIAITDTYDVVNRHTF